MVTETLLASNARKSQAAQGPMMQFMLDCARRKLVIGVAPVLVAADALDRKANRAPTPSLSLASSSGSAKDKHLKRVTH